MASTVTEYLLSTSNCGRHFGLRPLRTGILDIDRAHRYSRWLAEGSGEHDLGRLPPDLRTAPHRAVHAALAARLGLRKLDAEALMTCLTPPPMTPPNAAPPAYREWLGKGRELLREASQCHVLSAFPALFEDNQARLQRSLVDVSNLYNYCAFLGVSAALLNVVGLCEPLPQTQLDLAERIKWLLLPSAREKFRQPRQAFENYSHEHTVCDSFLALLGACQEQFGAERTQSYVQKRYLDAMYAVDAVDLVRTGPKNPAIRLQSVAGTDIKFRLLGESGRLSINSIFVVGVYRGVEQLGQGCGASMALAQRRAALDALCRMQLGENYCQ